MDHSRLFGENLMMIAENEDLLIEILLRLPAKSLIRFKLVCKRWFSIITSHCFYNRHTLLYRHHIGHFAPKPSFLICLSESFNYFYIQQSPHGAKLVPCHFFPTLVKPIICGSSNGLFLIQCDVVANPMGDCYIYNPTSQESRKISLNTNDNHTSVLGLNLAFDPLKSPHYKIICVRGSAPDVLGRRWWYQCQTEVYESNTGVWELCGEPFMVPSYTILSKGIYWNRSIHWHGVFFDFHGNHLRYHPEVVVSADTRRTQVSINYVESNGYLHYFAHVHKEKSVMVFELQRDYSEWSLMYRINLDMIPAPLAMLNMIRGENEEGDALLLQVPGKIMAYQFTNKSMKEIVNFGHEAFYKEPCNHFFPQLETFQYIETLAPP